MNANVNTPAISSVANIAAAASIDVNSLPSSTSNNSQAEQGEGKARRFVVAAVSAKSGRIIVGVWAVGASKWEAARSYKEPAAAFEAAMKIKEAEGLYISRKSYELLSKLCKQAEEAEKAEPAVEAPAAVEPLSDLQAERLLGSNSRKALAAELADARLRLQVFEAAESAIKANEVQFAGKVYNRRFLTALNKCRELSELKAVASKDINNDRYIVFHIHGLNGYIQSYLQLSLTEGGRLDFEALLANAAKDIYSYKQRVAQLEALAENYNLYAARFAVIAQQLGELYHEVGSSYVLDKFGFCAERLMSQARNVERSMASLIERGAEPTAESRAQVNAALVDKLPEAVV